MLFVTGKDRLDKHIHMAELDDYGDGLTDEAGEPPHVHEVSEGTVMGYSDGQYVSEHPGPIAPVNAETGEPQNLDAVNQDERQVASTSEAVIRAVSYITEGANPDELALLLIYG